jgi:hypothetical protein
MFCGFSIGVTFPTDKEYGKLLKTGDGSMISLFTGSFKISFTNLSTGKTISLNATSTIKQTNTSSSTSLNSGGHTVVLLTPAQAAQFGLPTLSLTAGRLTTEMSLATGDITSLSLDGTVQVNVCEALS